MAGLYLRNQDNARLSALLVILTGTARLQVRACCRAVLLFIVICVDCLLGFFGIRRTVVRLCTFMLINNKQ